MRRCPKGTRRIGIDCVSKSDIVKKRCPKGTRKVGNNCLEKPVKKRKYTKQIKKKSSSSEPYGIANYIY
jgi:hypothetical protein